MSAEERLIAQQKAQASRDAKKVFAEENMVLDYADEKYWRETASSLGVRLPSIYEVGPKSVRKMAKKLKVDINDFVSSTGFTSLKDLCDANPKWNSFAICGLLIEWIIENKYEQE